MNTIRSINNWFQLAIPEPTDANRAMQIGCHFEEVGEMCDALGGGKGSDDINRLSDHWKQLAGVEPTDANRKELLDALCDQIVTAIGVAHMFGMDIAGGLAEVDRSNWSKFVDGKPVFKPNGKIGKGPEYTEPNLESFL